MNDKFSHGPLEVMLASASISRAEMLRNAGLTIRTSPASIDEEQIKETLKAKGAAISEVTVTLADAKASRIAANYPDAMVVVADQILECGGEWFDKAPTMAAARSQLLKLRDREHRLVTSAVVRQKGTLLWRTTDVATLTMRNFSEEFLDWYLETNREDVLASVGCYRLELLGAQLFDKIEGDYFTVLGLPLLPMLEFFRTCGILRE